jgi:8-oxo-dGTP pyrophosphatase MutT (NUDIX family)
MATKLRDQTPDFEPPDSPHHQARRETGFFGRQAAGALVVAASTGRALFMLRSEDVLEPGTWGNNGGAHLAEEDPETAARREIREETGWDGDDADLVMIPAYVFTSGSFAYRNFIAVVPDEFDPISGWEATDHRWSAPDDLPSPLHFGMQALYADPDSLAILQGGWRAMLPPQPR